MSAQSDQNCGFFIDTNFLSQYNFLLLNLYFSNLLSTKKAKDRLKSSWYLHCNLVSQQTKICENAPFGSSVEVVEAEAAEC